jgi:high-affinity Fe2+/Pb2+ permease
LSSKDPKSRDTGSNVIVGGLFVQIIFFSVFVLAAWLFHTRMNKRPTNRALQVPWHRHMIALYIVSALIMARSIFRVVEFIQGFDGYLISHEVYTYIFDAALMLIAMTYMNWVHPSEIKMLMRGGKAAKGFKMQELHTPSQV